MARSKKGNEYARKNAKSYRLQLVFVCPCYLFDSGNTKPGARDWTSNFLRWSLQDDGEYGNGTSRNPNVAMGASRS